ncbi:FAD-binding oxidoreductase [Lutimaribacter sp. EGI FJ00015]|uniref:FAD-binding oxidoreductase n=1 Tax=Lutimaribacter degradans TaxID=2945989 RepID=A0ACC5ZYG6_9RHOB|nr:FAD-binding oxidoreductase [Lutimaribacter sp. EGI FJ00013]MCM2563392.1 FAD-binding oxidoreductase [Lutimaribacter sp. EGI FJ00013]MCO0614529.1 FAD-binding oxidoreductase [Lutimaribacter sp. EGI FJ00015]MCO0637202.1 FAD-binding oxidoreductase [Lutimaribacter sp. EGI FJ00014]
MLDKLSAIVGATNVMTGDARARWMTEWTGYFPSDPLAVVRPGSTEEVAQVIRLANETGTPVVPVSGNTGLAGGTQAVGAITLSLDRMNKIHEIRPDARIAIVDAGVILSDMHQAAEAESLIFPLTFGAKGSAMIGGVLSTNAGGSNVLRYGNTRDLVLGIEAVLPNGEVVNLMSELHKDNSGYNLRHLLVGAEGTLGVITRAVLKLMPKPRAYATAMVAVPTLEQALLLLNRLQEATGGAVEAFEYMPRNYIEAHKRLNPANRAPFDEMHDINLMVEVGATAPRDVTPGPDGVVPIAAHLEQTLADMFEQGLLLDAVVAQNDSQRQAMWERREAAAEIVMGSGRPVSNNDIAVPVDKVAEFFARMTPRLDALDPGAEPIVVAHLGDGNVHYAVWMSVEDARTKDAVTEAVEDEVLRLGGSFSAEHGIGQGKLSSMARRKDRVALAAMRAIKQALDPNGIMNPGKVLPPVND